MAHVDISGLDKALVLIALYNNTKPIGLGVLRAASEPMTYEEAMAVIVSGDDHGNRPLRFDYVKGRPIKTDIAGSLFDPRMYDRDNPNGEGAAAAAIDALRTSLMNNNTR